MVKVTLLILGIFLVSGLNPAWAAEEMGTNIYATKGIGNNSLFYGWGTEHYANPIHSGYADIGPSSIYTGGNTESIGPSSIYAGRNTVNIGPSSIFAGWNTEYDGANSIFAGYDGGSTIGNSIFAGYAGRNTVNIGPSSIYAGRNIKYGGAIPRKRKREYEKVTLEGTIIIEAEGSRSETVVLEVKDGTETTYYTLVGEQAEALKEHKGKQVKIEGVKTYFGWSINGYPKIRVKSWSLLPPAEFMEEIEGLKEVYSEAVQLLKDEILAVKDQILGLRQEKELAIEAVEKEFNDKLATAREDFMDELAAAIEEGRWEDTIGIIEDYLEERRGINEEKNLALEGLEKGFASEMQGLKDKLTGLNESINALRDAAKEEIEDLCEYYGVPYSEEYLNMVIPPIAPIIDDPIGIAHLNNTYEPILEPTGEPDPTGVADDPSADQTVSDSNEEVQFSSDGKPEKISYQFYKKLKELRKEYKGLVEDIKAMFQEEAEKIEKEIADLEEAKEAAIEAVEEEFKEQLTEARKEFIKNLITAIKEGQWEDIVGIVLDYLEERRGIINEKNEAIKILEEEFASEIQALRDKLSELEETLNATIEMLRDAAKADVEALCEEYGIPYSERYLNMVFPPSDIPGLLNIEVIGPDEFYKLSSEEQENYVLISKSSWANKNDVCDYALANPDELPSIGLDEYDELSDREKRKYVQVSESLWVKKSDIRKVARSLRKREYDEELPVGISAGEPDNPTTTNNNPEIETDQSEQLKKEEEPITVSPNMGGTIPGYYRGWKR